MMNINFYFIPSARVGYKERSLWKIIYALLFVRSPCPIKSKVVDFMNELAVKSNAVNVKIVLPQYFCEKIFDVIITSKIPSFVNVFFAHLDCGKYQKNIFTVMPLFYEDTFSVSNKGWGTLHSRSNELVSAFRDKTVALILSYSKSRHTKFPTTQSIRKKGERDVVLVVLQLPWDETIMKKSDVSWLEFLNIIYELARENSKEHIILRLHPLHVLEGKFLSAIIKIRGLGNVTLSEDELFYELERAKILILINSGVGFESLMFGRPVIAFGDSLYREFTCIANREMINKVSLSDMISRAQAALESFNVRYEGFIRANLYCKLDANKFWENEQKKCENV